MGRRLSIIIPVYNVEPYVGKTLSSVFDTDVSVEDFEVIIVNDGTKDGSMDVVRQFGDLPNLTIIEQENQGLSAARIRGLSMATGEYVWFVDSDDWLVEDSIKTVLEFLMKRPGVDVLMFPLMWVFEDPKQNHQDYHIEKNIDTSGSSVIRDLGLPVWGSPRFVIKRELMANDYLIFPKGLIYEDEYFGRVLMVLSRIVYVVKKSVYCYRSRPGSIISTRTVRSTYDMVSIHKMLMEFMTKNMTSDDQRWFRHDCFKLLQSCYSKFSSEFDSSYFKRFALRNGFYVWRQWLIVHPDKSIKNLIGRFLFYTMPGLRAHCLRRVCQ